MRSPYRVVKLKNRKGKTYFQVRFLDENGATIRSKSFPEAKTKTQVIRLAEKELKKGIVSQSSNPSAMDYIGEFWSVDSPYFRSKALKGRPLSESYRRNGFYNLKHFEPYLQGKTLLDITAKTLDDFAVELAGQGVNPRTINGGLDAVLRPFAVFCKRHEIPNRLHGQVEKHALRPKERGILTPDELSRICKVPDEPRAKLIILLGALCGLRKGEIRGLMYQDIDFQSGIVHVRHNYVLKEEGIKKPKCNSVRDVPIPAPVIAALEECAGIFPTGKFVVPSFVKDKPVDLSSITRGFRRILEFIGIDEAERLRRNLVIHGLRHSFVSLNRNAGMPDFIVAQLSGHRDLAMVDRYSHTAGLIDFVAARAAIEQSIRSDKKTGNGGV